MTADFPQHWTERRLPLFYERGHRSCGEFVNLTGCICTPPKNAIGDLQRTPSGQLRFETDGDPIPGDNPIELARLS